MRNCHKEVVDVNDNEIVRETQNIPCSSQNDDETQGVVFFINVDTSNTRVNN